MHKRVAIHSTQRTARSPLSMLYRALREARSVLYHAYQYSTGKFDVRGEREHRQCTVVSRVRAAVVV